jgi:hypothetical protein
MVVPHSCVSAVREGLELLPHFEVVAAVLLERNSGLLMGSKLYFCEQASVFYMLKQLITKCL